MNSGSTGPSAQAGAGLAARAGHAGVARVRQPGARLVGVARRRPAGEAPHDRLRLATAVVDHEHLVVVRRQRLVRQALERALEQLRPGAGADHRRDCGRHAKAA
jgi:hypothetical protein